MWSVGNEIFEQVTEDGWRLAQSLAGLCHALDPTRPVTVATSSGPRIVETADVAGYNYFRQNPIDDLRAAWPDRCAVGTEETTGCGTRGVYYPESGRMESLSRQAGENLIGTGWDFYDRRPWLGGLFFWTGFDYLGEPNPLSFPAVGSEFGILDSCGFPKDEAWYLRAWWTDQPVLHLFPHWNLQGHEGEKVSIWVYSNLDEVQLFVNGKNLGRKKMEKNGFLTWEATWRKGAVKAVGYKDGRKVLTRLVETTGEACRIAAETFVRPDVTVVDLFLQDRQGRFVPDARLPLAVRTEGPVKVLGFGNGDPAAGEGFSAFNGCAQLLLKVSGEGGRVHIGGDGLEPLCLSL